MLNNNRVKILSGIFIIALILRLWAVFSQEETNKLPRGDAAGYDEMAINLASGKGLSQFINGSLVPIAYRPPAYPVFLASVYSIFGHNYITVKIIQAVIGSVFCILIFYIVNMIYNDIITGLIAATCIALYKPFISGFSYYGGPALLLSEYLYMFMIGLSILTILYFIKNGNIKTGILSGIFAGLSILTRSEFVVFMGLLTIYLLHTSSLSIRNFFKKYFIMFLFIILTISPWAVRNYVVYKEFIPLSTLGGGIFWLGNNSLANGGQSDNSTYTIEDLLNHQKDKELFKKGIEELKNNPRRIPKLFIRKILVHWAPFENGFMLFNSFYAFILLFGSIGILFFRKKVILENILVLILLSTTLTAILTFGEPRYRYSYESYLVIFTALTFSELFKKIKGNIELFGGKKWKKT